MRPYRVPLATGSYWSSEHPLDAPQLSVMQPKETSSTYWLAGIAQSEETEERRVKQQERFLESTHGAWTFTHSLHDQSS
ncbi:hypothetical protein ILYODFUR_024110 [Ilyodon furcidens]|uniref:Uncharacterized protein n=1 Tax=Ilyodon furcidens TaxID=33524 RepID=A0ABV0SRB5_9TELE